MTSSANKSLRRIAANCSAFAGLGLFIGWLCLTGLLVGSRHANLGPEQEPAITAALIVMLVVSAGGAVSGAIMVLVAASVFVHALLEHVTKSET